MRAISIHQPYATFVAAGVKPVDNRTWTTDYRGRLAIHASQVAFAWPDADKLPQSFVERCAPWIGSDDLSDLPSDLRRYHDLILWCCRWYGVDYEPDMDMSWLREAVKQRGPALPMRAIVGEADLVDITRDSQSEFAMRNRYHWIFANPELYDTPVWPVTGRLRLFDVEYDKPV